ncbi:MAG: RNA polymerase sigma-54 factor [Spirochaetes bacterium ADurb.Bin215]|nr:MAG: RNA polymerase sigma-54 factor [Spirochaetes bacterium ADurb.Bin215]
MARNSGFLGKIISTILIAVFSILTLNLRCRILKVPMQGQKLVLSQQQRLTLSPQLVQSIKLMAMPFADLRERILEEVEKNPALEVVSDPFESIPWSQREPASRISVSTVRSNDDESDAHRDYIEGALSREETLQEHLLEQLGELVLEPRVRALAELVVQNLDPDGFHRVPPEELSGADDPAVLHKALDTVRRLEPVGCAVRDFHESLLVQAMVLRDRYTAGKTDPGLETTIHILDKYFHLLEKGRPDALVKGLAKEPDAGFTLDLEGAEEVFDIIRMLDPFPGRIFDSSPETYIVPDVFVNRSEEGYSVVINEEEVPVLGISPFFMELEEQVDDSARDFAREAVKEARWFLGTIERRNLTLLKLVRALVVFQREFFIHGPTRLMPLRMKDVAEEIGMHEATVSRAANGKYLQCEWGTFEIRYFFSNRVGSPPRTGSRTPDQAGGYTSGRFSKQGVKEVIRELIESSETALSDQKITEQLKTRGIHIARRTVAKYRAELSIASSFER